MTNHAVERFLAPIRRLWDESARAEEKSPSINSDLELASRLLMVLGSMPKAMLARKEGRVSVSRDDFKLWCREHSLEPQTTSADIAVEYVLQRIDALPDRVIPKISSEER